MFSLGSPAWTYSSSSPASSWSTRRVRWFGSARAPRVFLAHRIARIVPLYWATMMIYLAVVFLEPRLLNSEYLAPHFVLASFLFIPASRPDGLVQPLYSLGWTLNYEMFFYALFTIAVRFPRRHGVPALIAALMLLVTLGQIFAPLPQPFAFWTEPIILEFAMGMALGLVSAQGGSLNWTGRLVLALAGLALLMLDLTRAGEFLALPRAVAYGVPAALLVAAAALPGPARHEVRSALFRWGVILGDASYALYLLHPFVIRALRELVSRAGLATLIGPWGFVALSLACACALAVFVNQLFERPVTASARRLLGLALKSARYEDLGREPDVARGPSTPSA